MRRDPMRVYQEKELLRSYSEPTILWRNNRQVTLSGPSKPLNVVVNGELVFGSIADILNWSAGDIRSVELIRPDDARATVYGTPNGAVVIETVREVHLNQEEPQGELVRPFGLTIWSEEGNPSVSAPFLPGAYRLLIDVVTNEKQVLSFSKEFTVQ